jgi:hypothetical protein
VIRKGRFVVAAVKLEIHVPEFASHYCYRRFEQGVKTHSGFAHEDVEREFLETVLETAKERLTALRKNTILFRTQLGGAESRVSFHVGAEKYEEIEVANDSPHPLERMIPKAELVPDGRVNPKGTAVLYLATSNGAAISEMRPWVGQHITIARFRTLRDCQLVDCSLERMPSCISAFEDINLNDVNLEEAEEPEAKEPDAATKEKHVWGDIGYAFSKPVNRDEEQLDYVPTQRLADAFRNGGYDGIIYKSLLDEKGKNIAIFDPTAAMLTSCCLYKAHSGDFHYVKVNPVQEGYRARANSSQQNWDEIISAHFEERLY